MIIPGHQALLLVASAVALQRARPPLAGPRSQSLVRGAPLQVAPSGIDGLPEPLQALVFVGCYAGLGAGTLAATAGLDAARSAVCASSTTGAELWRKFISGVPAVGALFFLAGASHFTSAGAFEAIYPPIGTWGIWYLPGPAAFHVAWTGLAEVVLGGGLLAGGLVTWFERETPFRWLTPAAAAGLFLLTLAVTPANIYMYTHGATMTGLGPPGDLAVGFHYVRFAIQVALLSLLATLAKESFFFAWGDEVDPS